MENAADIPDIREGRVMASRFDYGLADIGSRIQQGMQQSQENRRENAMLDLDKRRVSAYESQLASTEAKRLSDMTEAQRRESIGRRALMKDPSLLPELFPGFKADPNDPEDARETEYIYSQLAAAYGGFEPPQQPQYPSSYNEYRLTQQDPGFGSYLNQQKQPKPQQEPDAIRTLRILAANPELADLDAGRRNKPPAGFRPRADGSGEFEPIPGGPADIKLKTQQKKEIDAKQKLDSLLDAEIGNIDKIIGSVDGKKKPHPGLSAMTGYIQSKIPAIIKGQDAQNALSLHNSLKSKASINALREIRSGGSQSIGQITEREWPRLEQMKVALDEAQSEEQYVQQLKEYRDELMLMKRNAESALSVEQSSSTSSQDDPLGIRQR